MHDRNSGEQSVAGSAGWLPLHETERIVQMLFGPELREVFERSIGAPDIELLGDFDGRGGIGGGQLRGHLGCNDLALVAVFEIRCPVDRGTGIGRGPESRDCRDSGICRPATLTARPSNGGSCRGLPR